MSAHITIDEMIDFLDTKELDAGFLGRAARINAHLLNCEECKSKFMILQTAEELFFKFKNYVPAPR